MGATWTVCVGLLLAWSLGNLKSGTVELARREAMAYFQKDQAFRLWATSHGGIYVPPTERTPVNPYLAHIPTRDVTTTEGMRLTLMNPAYMVRQLMEDYADLYGVKGRITSLNPIRPTNAPDAWQRAALEAFERGATEMMAVTEIDGKPYYRFMQPMIAKEGCLKCHGSQGYKAGDIRGGVSVAVPMAPLLEVERENARTIAIVHGVVYTMGLFGLVLAGRKIRQTMAGREQAEGLMRTIAENYPSYLSIIEQGNVVGFTSGREFARRELDPKSYEGMTVAEVFGERAPFVEEQYARAFAGEMVEFELLINGQHQSYTAVPLTDHHGRVTRLLAVAEDITERKRAEERIMASLKEKEVLLREVHHRVKNNMAIISSMLHLQSAYTEDPAHLGMFLECQSRVRSMALVHEKLYQSEDFSHIDVTGYIRSLAASIKATFAAAMPVEVRVETGGIVLDMDTLIPCGLIMNELMTNAVKHAFPPGAPSGQREMLVGLSECVDGLITLRVEDNGVGLPEGFDLAGSEGLGLRLVKALTMQLNGTLVAEPADGGGAAFSVVFPCPSETA
jgi:two-component sensor histidine kinase